MQYRRLTAHLDTNSADFNRRVAAYLTNHVAMRNALNQAISKSYSNQIGTDQGPPQNTPNMQKAQWPQPAPQYSNGMVPPQMLHRPSNANRHQPYPTPASQGGPGSKSQSPIESRKPSLQLNSQPYRRISSPTTYPQSAPPTKTSSSVSPAHRSKSASSLPYPGATPAPEMKERPSTFPPTISTSGHQQQFTYPEYQQNWASSPTFDTSPLTTTMPPETQTFFGGGNGFNNNFDTGYTTYGNTKGQNQAFYASGFGNNDYSMPYISGMSQTLAPSAADSDQFSWPTPTSASDSEPPTMNPFSFGAEWENDIMSKPLFPGSSQLTPADNDWSSYINTSSWDDLGT